MALDPADPAATASDAATVLRRLEDERQIRNLLARLSHLADRGAVDDYLALWAPDGVWEGSQDTARGHAALRERVLAYRGQGVQGPGSGTRHLSTTQCVDFPAPDVATADSYFMYVVDVETQPRIARVGRYADGLVRLGDEWRIVRRQILLGD